MKDIETRKDIQLLVDRFYAQATKDSLLGPIFNNVANVNWDDHLPIMYDFWETTLLHKNSYKRNTLEPHLALNKKIALEQKHFARWMDLFTKTVDELFEGKVAHNAKVRAQSIATVMQVKITQQNSN